MSTNDMRTPKAKISYLGSARSGTGDHILQRATALAIAPLAIFFLVSVVALAGAEYETARAYLANPLVSILFIALIGTVIIHMRIGVKIIIEDYVHGETAKHFTLIANSFFSYAIGLACILSLIHI